MRKFVLGVVSTIGAFTLVAMERVTAFSIGSQLWVFQGVRKVTANFFYALMNLIGKDIVQGVENQLQAASEAKSQNTELKLLVAATQVRDHAKELGDWTDHHTEALNAIGEALVTEMKWEEENVHQYLKSVVESIEGLEYGELD